MRRYNSVLGFWKQLEVNKKTQESSKEKFSRSSSLNPKTPTVELLSPRHKNSNSSHRDKQHKQSRKKKETEDKEHKGYFSSLPIHFFSGRSNWMILIIFSEEHKSSSRHADNTLADQKRNLQPQRNS